MLSVLMEAEGIVPHTTKKTPSYDMGIFAVPFGFGEEADRLIVFDRETGLKVFDEILKRGIAELLDESDIARLVSEFGKSKWKYQCLLPKRDKRQ